MTHSLPDLGSPTSEGYAKVRIPGSLKSQLKHFYVGDQWDTSVINLYILLTSGSQLEELTHDPLGEGKAGM